MDETTPGRRLEASPTGCLSDKKRMEEPLRAGDPGPPGHQGVPEDVPPESPRGIVPDHGGGPGQDEDPIVPRNGNVDHVVRAAQVPNPSLVPKYSFVGKYFSVSLGLALIMVYYTLVTHDQFFPAVESLGSSRLSLFVLGNLGFACSLVGYKATVRVFLGTLREYEVERVQDRIGQAIIETLLAMTIFRHNMETFGFISRFALLAFVKMFHWLAQDRVEFIETTANTTRTQHLRLVSMIVWLAVVDVCLLQNALESVFRVGISAHLLFAFEYSMQTTLALAILLKYTFSLIDMRCNGTWRGKSIAVFYVDLTRDMVHLITYTAFFLVVFSTYGIPIHLMRDIYWTFSSFMARVRAFLRFRQISSNMEDRFPTATAADLDRGDRMCIVCREDMEVEMSPKRLPCGHCFHLDCLKSWLERQQNCPICRRLIPAQEEAGDVGAGGAREDAARDEAAADAAEPAAADAAETAAETEAEASSIPTDARSDGANEETADTGGSRQAPDREAFLRRLEGRQEEDQGQPQEQEQQQAQEPAPEQPEAATDGLRHHRDPSRTASASSDDSATGADAPEDPRATDEPATTERPQLNSHALPSSPSHASAENEPPSEPPPVLLFPGPGTLMFEMPEFDAGADIGDTLRAAAARDLGLNPTDEQHERALAIAKASAHAAAVAAAMTER